MKIFHHPPCAHSCVPSWFPAPQPPPAESPGHLRFPSRDAVSAAGHAALLSPGPPERHSALTCLHDWLLACNLISPGLWSSASRVSGHLPPGRRLPWLALLPLARDTEHCRPSEHCTACRPFRKKLGSTTTRNPPPQGRHPYQDFPLPVKPHSVPSFPQPSTV